MKKMLSLLMVLTFCCLLVGCGDSSSSDSKSNTGYKPYGTYPAPKGK